MISLFIADVSGLDIDACLASVSPQRKEKTLRLKNDDDKRRSLGVELLLEKAAGRSDYALTENGKPFFPDGGAYFSLSHCGKYAVCAVSGVPVGADIELARDNALRLAERFFMPDEAALVERSPTPEAEFCRLWTLKESYIKAAGLRLGDVRTFSVVRGVEGYSFGSAGIGEYRIGYCVKAPDIGKIEIINEKL